MKQEAGISCTLLVFGTLKCTRGIYSAQALEGMSTSVTVKAGDGGQWDLKLRSWNS